MYMYIPKLYVHCVLQVYGSQWVVVFVVVVTARVTTSSPVAWSVMRGCYMNRIITSSPFPNLPFLLPLSPFFLPSLPLPLQYVLYYNITRLMGYTTILY